jgi:hypothetical protein
MTYSKWSQQPTLKTGRHRKAIRVGKLKLNYYAKVRN